MKKITKFFVILGLSATFMVTTEQRTARAVVPGLPTLDLSNFIQNVLDYLQSAEMGGLLSDISDIDMKVKAFMDHLESFKDLLDLMSMIREGAKYAQGIISTAQRMVNNTERAWRCIQYLDRNGADYAVIMAVNRCKNEFESFYEAILKDSETKTKFFDSFISKKSSDSSVSFIEILKTMDDFLKELEGDYNVAENAFERRMSQIYNQHCRTQIALQNGRIFRERCYF